jgi:hypothetical protein
VGCVIASSTFNAPVPPDALFGRTSKPALEVLCTNPAALGGGSGRLIAVYPSKPFAPSVIGAAANAALSGLPKRGTPWAAFPSSYTGRCSHADNASVLQLKPSTTTTFTITPTPDATWGTHLVNANIALGNLTNLVRRRIAIYSRP